MFLFIIYIFCNELVFKRLTKIIGNLFHFFKKDYIEHINVLEIHFGRWVDFLEGKKEHGRGILIY